MRVSQSTIRQRRFGSGRTSSASSHTSRALSLTGRRAEWQVSWGVWDRSVDWPGGKTPGIRSPEANSLQTSWLGRFSTELKNLGKRPVSARSVLAPVRTPLARIRTARANTLVRCCDRIPQVTISVHRRASVSSSWWRGAVRCRGRSWPCAERAKTARGGLDRKSFSSVVALIFACGDFTPTTARPHWLWGQSRKPWQHHPATAHFSRQSAPDARQTAWPTRPASSQS